jgi:hypothetical protein
MSTLVATRRNPLVQAFYARLLASGKKPKVALIACTRKFLIILNVVLRHENPWNPELPPSPLLFPPRSRARRRGSLVVTESPKRHDTFMIIVTG